MIVVKELNKIEHAPTRPQTKPVHQTIHNMLTVIFPYAYHSRSMYAAMEYIINHHMMRQEYRQQDAADEYNVSTVSVRTNRNKILDKLRDMDVEDFEEFFHSHGGMRGKEK